MHRGLGDPEVLGGGADGGLMFDDVHGQFPCPLFHVVSHHTHFPSSFYESVWPPQGGYDAQCRSEKAFSAKRGRAKAAH